MATVKAVVLKHQKRADGTWNIKIRITHGRSSAYMPTAHYITMDLINKKTFEIKERNNPIYDQVQLDVLAIRSKLSALGHSADCYTAKGLVKYITEKKEAGAGIDLLAFAARHIKGLVEAGRASRSYTFKHVVEDLASYTGNEHLPCSSINLPFLHGFEAYLQGRNLKESSVRIYMEAFRALLNAAKLEYNDEDTGVIRIPNNPFARYHFKKMPVTRKRALTAEQIRAIGKLNLLPEDGPTAFARDVFLLSFLLCGMNAIDLYNLTAVNGGRVEYERQKTRGIRKDNAFISVKVEPEAEALMEKLADKTNGRALALYRKCKNSDSLSAFLHNHLSKIGDMLGIEGLTFYAARHSWATIARNDCDISMDDVAICLNHKSGHDITDVYVKKDWSRIDRANRKVIDFVFGEYNNR